MSITASDIRQYSFTRLGDIKGEAAGLNVIAVIVDIVRQQRSSRGSHRDPLTLVALADETRDRVLATVFWSKPDQIPSFQTGFIFIGHRLKCEPFNGEIRLAVLPRIGGAIYLLPPVADDLGAGRPVECDDGESELARSIVADRRRLRQSASVTDADLARARELRVWFQTSFRPSSSAATSAQTSASAAPAAAPASNSACQRLSLSDLSKLQFQRVGSRRFFDLMAQLVAVGPIDAKCALARVWDGTELSAVTFSPSQEAAANLQIKEWSELSSAQLADRYTVDIFVYDEHREALLSGKFQLGDLIEFGNLSVKLFNVPDGVGVGNGRREQLLLSMNGGGQAYNRRLCRLDPKYCNLAAKLSEKIDFVRRYRLQQPAIRVTTEPEAEALATTTMATTTELMTVADERLADVERVSLANLIRSATESEAGHRIIRANLVRLLPATADRLVWLLCANCESAFGPEELSIQSYSAESDEGEAEQRRRPRPFVCRRCRQHSAATGERPLRPSLCIGLHLADSDAELMAFAWDAEALRLIDDRRGVDDLGDDVDAARLAADAELRRRVYSKLRERLPTGARVELSIVHYRTAASGTVVYSICDTFIRSEADLAAAAAAAASLIDDSTRSDDESDELA